MLETSKIIVISYVLFSPTVLILFFFTATAPTEIYTLSLHDALPISAFVPSNSSIVTFGFAFVYSAMTSRGDRKSTRLNSSHVEMSYAVCCLKKKIPRTVAQAEALDRMFKETGSSGLDHVVSFDVPNVEIIRRLFFFFMLRPPQTSTLFPYTTLFR